MKKKTLEEVMKESPVTYEIYAEMPDDGKRYEVIDGMLELMSPGPTAAHQSISLELIHELRQGCKTDYLIYVAPLDVILSHTNVVQPDVLMIHRSRRHIVTSRGVEGLRKSWRAGILDRRSGSPNVGAVSAERSQTIRVARIVRGRRPGRFGQADLRVIRRQPHFQRHSSMRGSLFQFERDFPPFSIDVLRRSR